MRNCASPASSAGTAAGAGDGRAWIIEQISSPPLGGEIHTISDVVCTASSLQEGESMMYWTELQGAQTHLGAKCCGSSKGTAKAK